MADAAIETCEQAAALVGDAGGFAVGNPGEIGMEV